jgi:hypothetical protein
MGISELQLTPQPAQGRKNVLGNLKGLSVWVDEQPGSTGEQAGLTTAEIRSFVEVMLRIARVAVLENIEGAEGQPRLHVKLNAVKVVDLYSVYISLDLMEWVRAMRMPTETIVGDSVIDAATWQASANFVVNRHELRDASKAELGKLMAKFMNEYVAANAS